MNSVLEQRQITWQLLFKVSQFSEGDIDQPIDCEDLEDPESPLVRTLLYIYSMESPLRYRLVEATQ